jgi:hypothetical protein
MAEAKPSALCVHQHYLNNDIHKLVLQEDTTDAVDAAIAHMDDILNTHDANRPLLLLIDVRQSGVPPLQYFFRSVRKLYSGRENLPAIRAAYLYQDNVLLVLIQAFFDALRLTLGMEASRRFMQDAKEFEAVEWLLQTENDDS